MIIAVFLDNMNYKHLDKNMKRVFLFFVRDEIITEIGENFITVLDIHYLLLWLINNKVKFIYIDNIDENTKSIIERCDIIVKELKDIKENPLLKALLLKKEEENNKE